MDFLFISVDPAVLLFLFCTAMVAGIIDTLAGGGGLLTVPALLIAGIPPHMALGTNRLQACIGEFTAAARFKQKGAFEVKYIATGALFTALGAVFGTIMVSWLPKELLEKLLPVLMVLITVYSIFSKSLRRKDAVQGLITAPVFMISMGILIGFYNGFFGPGTGSIWMLAFIILLGTTIQQASISTKPLNLIGNLVSLLVFIWLAQVNWILGALMGLGQVIGAVIGSHLVLEKGSQLIRPVFVTVTLAMTVGLILRNSSL